MTEASAVRWPLLSTEFHRVRTFKHPTDRAAQIAIEEARQGGRLRMRATRFEYKAQPGLRLAPGEQPPRLEPIITPVLIYPTDIFDHWDLERSCARLRRDAKGKSIVWYRQIEIHPDDAQNLWPSEPETTPKPPKESIDLPRTEWSEFPAGSPMLEGPKKPESGSRKLLLKGRNKPARVPHKLWSVILTLDAMEAGGDDLKTAYPNKEALRVAVSQRLSKGITLSLRQLGKAEAWWRKYKNSPKETQHK